MTKELPVHLDKLGRELAVGDAVCYPHSNTLYIGTIVKINPKMIKVQKIGKLRWSSEHNKYSFDLIKLDSAEVTMYALKYQ